MQAFASISTGLLDLELADQLRSFPYEPLSLPGGNTTDIAHGQMGQIRRQLPTNVPVGLPAALRMTLRTIGDEHYNVLSQRSRPSPMASSSNAMAMANEPAPVPPNSSEIVITARHVVVPANVTGKASHAVTSSLHVVPLREVTVGNDLGDDWVMVEHANTPPPPYAMRDPLEEHWTSATERQDFLRIFQNAEGERRGNG